MTTDPVQDESDRADKADKQSAVYDALKQSRLNVLALDEVSINDFIYDDAEHEKQTVHQGLLIPSTFGNLVSMALRTEDKDHAYLICKALRERFDAYYDTVANSYAEKRVAENMEK
jgi:ABC-type amino acid transport substrate-binding protein